ncbi:hypothetical protein CHS0354_016612 [Potamilus streckersoni]|uniref:DNA-directed DNA polymerase family A palm domain-containing protein n=1 Tax=Potamilus streckersoni TaxID=2493646 RepID=A0AAE0TI81_9BIVA|nr:hypothetical protein CHS0354_016612 [Potamilus streckersoni]
MNPVLQPAFNPPKLDDFSDLSPDAQLILAKLTKKYLQIQELQKPQTGPGISYRRNHAGRFGRDAVSQDYHNKSTSSSTPNMYNTSTEIHMLSPIETQDYQKLSELPRHYHASKSETSDISPPIETQDYVRLSQSLKQKKFTAEKIGESKRTQNNPISPSLFSQDLHDIEFVPRAVLFACHENVDSVPMEIVSSPEKQNRHLCMKVRKENIFNSETNNFLDGLHIHNTDYLATAGNHSKCCDVLASNSNLLSMTHDINDINGQDERQIDKNDFGMDFSLIPSEVIRVEDRFDDKTSGQCTAVEELSSVIKHGQLKMVDSAGLISKNQISTSEVSGVNMSSSISKKLAYLRTVRLTNTSSDVGDSATSSNGCRKENKENFAKEKQFKPQRTLSQFCTPFKKQKLDNNTDQLLQYTTDTVCVSSLHEKKLLEICSCIRNSKEVLLTLLLDENTSQLSDDGASDTKRKQNSKARDLENTKIFDIAVLCLNKLDRDMTSGTLPVYIFPKDMCGNVFDLTRTFWDELLRSDSRKVCYNSKELMISLLRQYCFDASSVSTCWTVLDPMVAMWILDPDRPAMSFPQIVTTLNLTQQISTLSMATINRDLRNLSAVMKELYQRLMAQDMWELFYKVEMKLTPVLAAMEITEFKIDTSILGNFSDILKKKLLQLEEKAHECVGHTFSLTSHPQLRQVLFEELRLNAMLPQTTKLTKTSVGHEPSTSEVVLNHLTKYHPLPGIILEHRQLQKLKCTYVDGILSCVKKDKLLTHWDQTAAATGRVTSFQPNVQTIPKVPVTIIFMNKSYVIGKEDEERKVVIFARDPFISHEGYSFMAADFQQIELRLLAHLASDPLLLKIFNNPESPDIFFELTSQWLGKPALEVTNAEREQTKRVVYSIMYGAGKEKLAEYLRVSVETAKAMMTSFQAKFPAVSQFSKKCISFCQKNGYTTTIFKRRRKFQNINHPAPHLSAQAERQAINFCVQGSAADLCKAAMIQLQLALNCRHHLKARLLIQIHDEILLEVADEHINEVKDIVKRVMESGDSLCGHMVKLKVPIKVSVSVGKRWGHMSAIS